MTFTEYKSSVSHPFEQRAAQRRLERATYIAAVIVGICGAILLGATLSGCGGSVEQASGCFEVSGQCSPTVPGAPGDHGRAFQCAGVSPAAVSMPDARCGVLTPSMKQVGDMQTWEVCCP